MTKQLDERLDEILKPRFDISVEICTECKHNAYSHYWNGGLRPDLHSGWDSCKADNCKCVGDYEGGDLKTEISEQYDTRELDEAKQDIKTLISEEVDKARISELQGFVDKFDEYIDDYDIYPDIEERIAQLKSNLEKGKDESR